MGRWVTTILFLFGSAVLTHWIPFSSFFRNVDTMVHEFGHAAATLLLSGQVRSIHLFADHSGVTYSYIEAGWRVIPVALAGYLTASLFAVFLFQAHSRGRQQVGFAAMLLLAAASLTLFVRNEFGVVWLIGFIVVNGIAMMFPGRWLRSFYYLLVAFICLEESVAGPINLLVLSLTDPGKAGDAAGLSEATAVPATVWAIGFLLFALICARKAIASFLGGVSSRSSGKRQYE